MKILHLSMIIFLFALVPILLNVAFGSEQCPTSGYIHYGPSRQSIPCYLVSPPPNPTFEEQFGSSTKTKIVHDDAILILNQTTKKLVYQSGEEITITPELINIGNKSIDIAYWEPIFFLEIKNQTGDVVWPQYTTVAYIPEFHGIKTLKPREQFGVRAWTTPTGPISDPGHITVNATGNYTAISVATFTFDTNTNRLNSLEPLWSKPLQITIIPELSSVTITGNQTTNQSSLQEQLNIGQRPIGNEMVQRNQEQQNQTLIVLIIGIPITAISVVILLILRQRNRKY